MQSESANNCDETNNIELVESSVGEKSPEIFVDPFNLGSLLKPSTSKKEKEEISFVKPSTSSNVNPETLSNLPSSSTKADKVSEWLSKTNFAEGTDRAPTPSLIDITSNIGSVSDVGVLSDVESLDEEVSPYTQWGFTQEFPPAADVVKAFLNSMRKN